MSANELTLKQQRWVNAYLETGNATEAARQAGYGANEDGLRVIGCQNLTKLNIKRRIETRLAEEGITSTEALNTLASHARADITDLFDETGIIDLQTVRERGLGHLIKKIKRKRRYEKDGEEVVPVDELEIELHDPQKALMQICKMMGWEQMPAINDRDYARSGESALQTWLKEAAAAQGLPEPLPATPENVQMWVDKMRPGAQDKPDLLAFLDQKEQSLARGQDSQLTN